MKNCWLPLSELLPPSCYGNRDNFNQLQYLNVSKDITYPFTCSWQLPIMATVQVCKDTVLVLATNKQIDRCISLARDTFMYLILYYYLCLFAPDTILHFYIISCKLKDLNHIKDVKRLTFKFPKEVLVWKSKITAN